jgi:hypothetical protein
VADSKNVAIAVAVIGAAATLGAAWIAKSGNGDDGSANGSGGGGITNVGGGGGVITIPTISGNPTEPAQLFLNRDSGPGGTTIVVSGRGFVGGERVVLSFHTQQIGSTNASESGAFSNVSVTIPSQFSQFAPQQFDVIARGERSIKSASAPFTISG